MSKGMHATCKGGLLHDIMRWGSQLSPLWAQALVNWRSKLGSAHLGPEWPEMLSWAGVAHLLAPLSCPVPHVVPMVLAMILGTCGLNRHQCLTF
jgi:hypothetical protein